MANSNEMTRFERMEWILEFLTPQDLLTNLVMSMSEDEANANFDYIVRTQEIPTSEDIQDELEEDRLSELESMYC